MSSKRKIELPPTPKTFKEVKSLSLKDLKALCNDANIPVKDMGRDSLEILFCIEIGIGSSSSGTGPTSQATHFAPKKIPTATKLLAPTSLIKMKGWSKDIKCIPDIDIHDVKSYLLSSNCTEFNKENLRAYKLTRSYQHLNAGHICNVSTITLDSFCVVRGSCLPSQSSEDARIKYLHVVLDKNTGEPYGGFCTCTVGLTQACSHIGALLFLLADIIAKGENLPEDQAVTERLCSWINPKGAKVVPQKAEDLEIRTEEKQRPSIKDYATYAAPELSKEANYQRVLQLLYDVRNANKGYEMPAITKIVDLNKFRPNPIPEVKGPISLPFKCDEQSQFLAYAKEVEITTTPIAITNIPFSTRQQFLTSLDQTYTEDDLNEIEKITRGQSKTDEWYLHRKGALTASICGKILNYYENETLSKKRSIMESIFQSQKFDLSSLSSIKWGRKHEKTALDQLFSRLSADHVNSEISQPGLLTHRQYHYIRATPDAIFNCKCHGQTIVEIKCPYSCREIDPTTAIMDKKITYVKQEGENLLLVKRHHMGYFEQVQQQLAVSKIGKAIFVIWTKKGFLEIPIEIDRVYWEQEMMPRLKRFFEDHVIPVLEKENDGNEGEDNDENEQLTVEVIPVLGKENDGNELNEGEDNDENEQLTVEVNKGGNETIATSEQLLPIETGSDNNIDDQISNGSESEMEEEDEAWNLGCAAYCRDHRAPTFSSVKGKLIACDVNLLCPQNTWYHLFCEGFRRFNNENLNKKYVCQRCQPLHPQYEQLKASNGFY